VVVVVMAPVARAVARVVVVEAAAEVEEVCRSYFLFLFHFPKQMAVEVEGVAVGAVGVVQPAAVDAEGAVHQVMEVVMDVCII